MAKREFGRYLGAAKKAYPATHPAGQAKIAAGAYQKMNPGEPFSDEKRSRKGESGNPVTKICPYCSKPIGIELTLKQASGGGLK